MIDLNANFCAHSDTPAHIAGHDAWGSYNQGVWDLSQEWGSCIIIIISGNLV